MCQVYSQVWPLDSSDVKLGWWQGWYFTSALWLLPLLILVAVASADPCVCWLWCSHCAATELSTASGARGCHLP
jgi:hypothetical protein